MVSVLAFYSDDQSSNNAQVYNFLKLWLKRIKINQKDWDWLILVKQLVFCWAAIAPSVNNPTARVQIPSPIPRYALFGQTVECLVLDPLPKMRL